MQLSGAPTKIVEAFAVNGNMRVIPVPSQASITPGAASYNDGFPPLNGTPVSSGGIPPSILDMNGILNGMSAVDMFMSAGGVFSYDASFSASIGGYPKGARVVNAASTGYLLSTTDNNTTNPYTNGAGWIPDRATASVYANNTQTLAVGNSKIIWNTVSWDPFGLWNASSSVFQAAWPGKYKLSGSVYLTAPAAQLIGCNIYKNGALARACGLYPQVSDGDMDYNFSGIMNCVIGDQLDTVMSIQSTAVTCAAGDAFVFGQIEYLGA
jgi:hypothetical protein